MSPSSEAQENAETRWDVLMRHRDGTVRARVGRGLSREAAERRAATCEVQWPDRYTAVLVFTGGEKSTAVRGEDVETAEGGRQALPTAVHHEKRKKL